MQGGIFSEGETMVPPVSGDQFREHIVQTYADQADSIGIDACIGAAVDAIWPAPEYRPHQRDAVIDLLHGLYVDENDVMTLSAPTGAGKSLILHAVMAVLDNEFRRDAFFTTPLNALIDQVDGDEFIQDDVLTLKGKSNYTCVHRMDSGAPVDKAICQRTDDFDCQHKHVDHRNGGCPYYGRKSVAQNHPEVVTNLSYLMANSMIPETIDSKLNPRELLVVDECQSIEDFALQFVTVTVSDTAVPIVYDRITPPPDTDDVDRLVYWLRNEVMPAVETKIIELDGLTELTQQQADDLEDLQRFARKVQNLVSDVANNHWVANTNVEHNNEWDVEFKPIFIGRFLESFLWAQSNKVILSSATIPTDGFLEEVGLADRSVGHVEVESTFPPARRSVYTDDAVGKMTMAERDRTIPQMAERIGDLAEHYWEEGSFRGFVHCHSYKIARRLYDRMPHEVKMRTRVQDQDDREDSLDRWLDAPVDQTGFDQDRGGQVFLSVAMDEGISLDDWRARWQVIAKAAYPYMGPEAKRANYRMDELNDWNWYAGKAAINLQQAVGRGMRSQDDWCHTHVLDASAVTLIERNEHLFEDWFLDAVDVSPSNDIPGRA